MKKTRLPKLLGFLIIIMLISQVIASNRLATSGLAITKIEQEIASISEENADLRQKIASASSFLTIEEKAKRLGFTHATRPVYVSDRVPVALDIR